MEVKLNRTTKHNTKIHKRAYMSSIVLIMILIVLHITSYPIIHASDLQF